MGRFLILMGSVKIQEIINFGWSKFFYNEYLLNLRKQSSAEIFQNELAKKKKKEETIGQIRKYPLVSRVVAITFDRYGFPWI